MPKVMLRERKKLFIAIDRFFAKQGMITCFEKQGVKHQMISEKVETGSKSIIINFKRFELRLRMEKFLETAGFMVNKEYKAGHGYIEVKVKD